MRNHFAVVTGASSGFGLLTTVSLAKAGYTVVAGLRSPERKRLLLDAAIRARVAEKIDCHLLDVTVPEQIAETAAYVQQKYGSVDVLINNAGFALGGFAEDVRTEELRQQFETNFFGAVQMTKAFLPMMRKQRSGHIVMISSISGRNGFPGLSSYVASKFALEGWTETLRMEVRSLGIEVILIEPGAYDTDIWNRNARVTETSSAEESPNQERIVHLREGIQSRSEERANAQEVADQIVRVVKNPHPKLRYVMGRDAHTLLMLRRLLPWGILEKMLIKSSKIDG
ncbi:MAG: SDR family oxidoreductase [Acidobacteriaceae bacterium]